MARLSPSTNTVKRLFANSGNKCAFPDCNHKLINEKGKFVAQICHIEAAEKLGERYNELMTDEERRSYENLLILCYAHHVETDDIEDYTVAVLKEIKRKHEEKFINDPYSPKDSAIEEAINKLNLQYEKIISEISEAKELTKYGNTINERTLAILESSTISIDNTKIYSTQLNFLKGLREEGKSKTALEALLKFKKEHWKQINDELKFKVVINTAITLLDLGRKNEAGRYLLILENISYENEDSLSYLALGYAILNNLESFKELLSNELLINSKNINLWLAHIMIFTDCKTPEELRDDLPKELLDKAEILFALGEVFIDAGKEEGFEMLEQCIKESTEPTYKKWQLIGNICAKKLINIITNEKAAFKNFSIAEISKLNHLIKEMTNCWNYISKTEMVSISWYIIMNRGLAYKMLNQHQNAEKDFEEAWKIAGNYATYRNLILEYMETKNHEKANDLIHISDAATLQGFNKIEYAALKIRISFIKNPHENSIKIIKEELKNISIEDKATLLNFSIIWGFENNAHDKLLPLINMLIECGTNTPDSYIYKGSYFRHRGNTSQAKKNLKIAESLISDNEKKDVNLHLLGTEYYYLKEYQRSINCFEKMKTLYINSASLEMLALCYFYSGKYEFCEKICKQTHNSAVTSEVLLHIYKNTNRHMEAILLVENYIQNKENEHLDYFRLMGTILHKEVNDLQNALLLLQQIETPQKLSLPQQFRISRLHLEFGDIDKALEIAYNVRLNNFEDFKAHDYYFKNNVGIRSEPKETMYPSKISIDNSVELLDEFGTSSTYLITDDTRCSGPNILRTEDPLAKLVLNKSIGDQIKIKNNLGRGSSLTVNFIMSKYTFAFRESVHLLTTKYAGVSEIYSFRP